MATESLQMVRLTLDPARLARLGKAVGLPPQEEDLGYRVHMALAGLFGPGKIQPFRVLDGPGRGVDVLGYTSYESKEAINDDASSFADPGLYDACDWQRLGVKPMPSSWQEGRVVGFEVRICPIVRPSKDIDRTPPTNENAANLITLKKGAEVDAWVHHNCTVHGNDPLNREAVYRNWLSQRTSHALELRSMSLHAFRRIRLVRRSQGAKRTSKILERPDALVRGELEIRDADAFQKLLANGVGRHRAFGFGMMLLRRPG